MQESETARENKKYNLFLTWRSLPQCLLHEDRFEAFIKNFDFRFKLADEIMIQLEFERRQKLGGGICAEHNIGEVMGMIIARIPTRFDFKKISYMNKGYEKVNIELMLKVILKHKPDFVFNEFRFKGLFCTTKRFSQPLEYFLFNKVHELSIEHAEIGPE